MTFFDKLYSPTCSKRNRVDIFVQTAQFKVKELMQNS